MVKLDWDKHHFVNFGYLWPVPILYSWKYYSNILLHLQFRNHLWRIFKSRKGKNYQLNNYFICHLQQHNNDIWNLFYWCFQTEDPFKGINWHTNLFQSVCSDQWKSNQKGNETISLESISIHGNNINRILSWSNWSHSTQLFKFECIYILG